MVSAYLTRFRENEITQNNISTGADTHSCTRWLPEVSSSFHRSVNLWWESGAIGSRDAITTSRYHVLPEGLAFHQVNGVAVLRRGTASAAQLSQRPLFPLPLPLAGDEWDSFSSQHADDVIESPWHPSRRGKRSKSCSCHTCPGGFASGKSWELMQSETVSSPYKNSVQQRSKRN